MTNDLEATSSCCSTSPSTSAPTPAAAGNGREDLLTGGGAADDMTTCPVMVGNPVSKAAAMATGLYRDYEGERYYFCCGGCGPAFDADPAKYAANMA